MWCNARAKIYLQWRHCQLSPERRNPSNKPMWNIGGRFTHSPKSTPTCPNKQGITTIKITWKFNPAQKFPVSLIQTDRHKLDHYLVEISLAQNDPNTPHLRHNHPNSGNGSNPSIPQIRIKPNPCNGVETAEILRNTKQMHPGGAGSGSPHEEKRGTWGPAPVCGTWGSPRAWWRPPCPSSCRAEARLLLLSRRSSKRSEREVGERKREEADGHSCPVSCTPWCGGAVLVQAVHSAPIWWVGLGFEPKRNSLHRIGGPKSGELNGPISFLCDQTKSSQIQLVCLSTLWSLIFQFTFQLYSI